MSGAGGARDSGARDSGARCSLDALHRLKFYKRQKDWRYGRESSRINVESLKPPEPTPVNKRRQRRRPRVGAVFPPVAGESQREASDLNNTHSLSESADAGSVPNLLDLHPDVVSASFLRSRSLDHLPDEETFCVEVGQRPHSSRIELCSHDSMVAVKNIIPQPAPLGPPANRKHMNTQNTSDSGWSGTNLEKNTLAGRSTEQHYYPSNRDFINKKRCYDTKVFTDPGTFSEDEASDYRESCNFTGIVTDKRGFDNFPTRNETDYKTGFDCSTRNVYREEVDEWSKKNGILNQREYDYSTKIISDRVEFEERPSMNDVNKREYYNSTRVLTNESKYHKWSSSDNRCSDNFSTIVSDHVGYDHWSTRDGILNKNRSDDNNGNWTDKTTNEWSKKDMFDKRGSDNCSRVVPQQVGFDKWPTRDVIGDERSEYNNRMVTDQLIFDEWSERNDNTNNRESDHYSKKLVYQGDHNYVKFSSRDDIVNASKLSEKFGRMATGPNEADERQTGGLTYDARLRTEERMIYKDYADFRDIQREVGYKGREEIYGWGNEVDREDLNDWETYDSKYDLRQVPEQQISGNIVTKFGIDNTFNIDKCVKDDWKPNQRMNVREIEHSQRDYELRKCNLFASGNSLNRDMVSNAQKEIYRDDKRNLIQVIENSHPVGCEIQEYNMFASAYTFNNDIRNNTDREIFRDDYKRNEISNANETSMSLAISNSVLPYESDISKYWYENQEVEDRANYQTGNRCKDHADRQLNIQNENAVFNQWNLTFEGKAFDDEYTNQQPRRDLDNIETPYNRGHVDCNNAYIREEISKKTTIQLNNDYELSLVDEYKAYYVQPVNTERYGNVGGMGPSYAVGMGRGRAMRAWLESSDPAPSYRH